MPLASWLFLKDQKSIWVERPFGTALIIAGPDDKREQREFVSEAALDAFQVMLAERLAGDGWFLWGVNRDRRVEAAESEARRDERRRRSPVPD